MQNTLERFERIVQKLLDEERANPVSKYIPSNELFRTLDLGLDENGMGEEQFEKALEDLVLNTPRTATNGFFNQLFGGRNEKAVLGDLLAVILNNSMYTYKAAGAQIGVEKVIIRKLCDELGWDDKSDGAFAPGGSMTNFMSMLMARDRSDASVRKSGSNNKMTVYTSVESHYSIPKNAAFSGIGRDNVRYIPTDDKGVLNVEKLELAIEKDVEDGYNPVLVNVTAGTTVLGAFDPIIPVRELCDRHNIWLHVDGAYCGAVILSKKYKHLIDGIELADSFSVNAHKMMGTPTNCSLILVRDKKYLYDSFSIDADYLYQTDHDEFNMGKTSLQCGRRNDALKLWTLWKSIGTKGLEKMVDQQFMLADVARDYIINHPEYSLYSFEDSLSICFNYKDIPARTICTHLYEHSKMLVSYGSFRDQEFIRLVTINAQNKPEDILNFFSVLESFVNENYEN